jgi:hypothetical protein
MKTTPKRILAILLAILMTLGISTVASAATPEEPIQLQSSKAPVAEKANPAAPRGPRLPTAQPSRVKSARAPALQSAGPYVTAISFSPADPVVASYYTELGWWGQSYEPAATLTYSDGSTETVTDWWGWDEATDFWYDMWLDWPGDTFSVGANAVTVYYQDSVLEEMFFAATLPPRPADDAPEAEWEDYWEAWDAAREAYCAALPQTAAVVTGLSVASLPVDSALALNAAKSVSVAANQLKVYTFQPAQDGLYQFSSALQGSADPLGFVLDSNCKLIAMGDDDYRNETYSLNFRFGARLEKDKTYYVVVLELSGEPGAFSLTVTPVAFQLLGNKIRVQYHTRGWFEAFNEDYPGVVGYGYARGPASIEFRDYSQNRFNVSGLRRGKTTLNFSELIDEQNDQWLYLGGVEVEVYYSFWQWMEVIFLFGWIWLPQTGYTDVGQIL